MTDHGNAPSSHRSRALVPSPLRVIRRLSIEGEPLVQVGDRVEAEDALLSMSTFPGKVLHSDMARELRVGPDETEGCLLHPQGTMIAPGEVLGRSSMFWHHRLARSPHEGSVAGVSPSLGVVYMREHLPTQLAETVRIDIVAELRGDKNNYHSYLRVKEGDKVEKGQILATRQEAGAKYHNVTSPVYGTVSTIVPLMGSMSIIPDTVSSVLIAHVPGIVRAIHGGREVEITGYGIAFEGLLGVGGEARGLLRATANEPRPWRAGGSGDGDLSGCVLVTGNVDQRSLTEAAGMGVAGIIAGQAHQGEVSRFLGRELGVIATGDEDVSPVLILTGGFGGGRMDPSLHARFSALGGRLASLSGTTHIRAGVIRPRVIVSFPMPPESELRAQGAATEITAHEMESRRGAQALAPGGRVSVLRGPWAGRTGVIKHLPLQPQEIASGSRVLVAMVRLDAPDRAGPGAGTGPGAGAGAGDEVMVAQANLQREEHGA